MFRIRSLSARGCGPGPKRLALFSLVLLLSGTGDPLAAASLDLPLTGDAVSLRAGASVRLPLSSEALGWLPGLSEIRTVSDPPARYPVSAGLSKDGSGLFLAVPPTMPPGRYTVGISALAAGGAEVTGKLGSSGFLVGGTGRGAASWVTGGRSVDRSSASRARLTLVLETRVPSCYPLSLV